MKALLDGLAGLIFDLFVQDTKVLTRNNRELGIGLAVVRDLVEAHGGHVVGRSGGRGLGSEFAVTLPLSRPREFAAGEGVTG